MYVWGGLGCNICLPGVPKKEAGRTKSMSGSCESWGPGHSTQERGWGGGWGRTFGTTWVMEMKKSPEEEAALAHRRGPWLLDFIELGDLGAVILSSQDSLPGTASHENIGPRQRETRDALVQRFTTCNPQITSLNLEGQAWAILRKTAACLQAWEGMNFS